MRLKRTKKVKFIGSFVDLNAGIFDTENFGRNGCQSAFSSGGRTKFKYRVKSRAIFHLQEHQQNRPDKPLFMVVHFFDPHYDYILHPDHLDTYPDYEGPVESAMVVKDLKQTVRDLGKGDDKQALEDGLRKVYSLYDSEIRFTDYHLGRFLDALEKSGRMDNSIVVVVGDHGDELGDRETRWIGHTKVVSQEVYDDWVARTKTAALGSSAPVQVASAD